MKELKIDYSIVIIEWRDAFSNADWRSPDTLEKDAIMHTAGFLVSEGGEFTIITQTVSPEGEIAHTINIPRGMIKKIRKLK